MTCIIQHQAEEQKAFATLFKIGCEIFPKFIPSKLTPKPTHQPIHIGQHRNFPSGLYKLVIRRRKDSVSLDPVMANVMPYVNRAQKTMRRLSLASASAATD